MKKYYFEKESQVHQLQNTIAHQRLSQSRTSLDDSEYAARFSRLDGLISQLAFSIRKNWKTIPDFLHRGVNKDALVTGKQEMTAVGKAYMSNWLVTNLFDMYFHPDLELGLSKDMKEMWHNIRRFCPPFQSGEEEEALMAKMLNWRLTTLEGLQERLRSAEAHSHHQRLVEMLNEKMVGDMALLLVDPPPPDLAGGISMIGPGGECCRSYPIGESGRVRGVLYAWVADCAGRHEGGERYSRTDQPHRSHRDIAVIGHECTSRFSGSR